MGYKSTDPCLAKVAEDEPIFILRAQDRLAPNLVRDWADEAEAAGHCPPEKIAEARALAAEMERWAFRKFPD